MNVQGAANPSDILGGENIYKAIFELHVSQYLSASGLVILLYDTLLLLPDELRFLSESQQIFKWIFIANKYIVITSLIFILIATSGLSHLTLSDKFCKGTLTTATILGGPSIAIVSILAIVSIMRVSNLRRYIFTLSAITILIAFAAFGTVIFTLVKIFPTIQFVPMLGISPVGGNTTRGVAVPTRNTRDVAVPTMAPMSNSTFHKNQKAIYRIYPAHVSGLRIGVVPPYTDGCKLIAWGTDNFALDHLWIITPVSGESDTYSIRNLYSGNHMDMQSGSSSDNTPIIVWSGEGENHKWIIKETPGGSSGEYKIQNKLTKTFIDLYYGRSSPGTGIVGWQGSWNPRSSSDPVSHQDWKFECLSMSSNEIRTLIVDNPYTNNKIYSFRTDYHYLLLPKAKILEVYRNSGIGTREWREEIYDCDDFANATRGLFADWGTNIFKADGFAVLCGRMDGRNLHGAHAYNFFVDDDQKSIIFFEPQNNGYFTVNAEGYKGYLNIY